jgi:hypothetical protein
MKQKFQLGITDSEAQGLKDKKNKLLQEQQSAIEEYLNNRKNVYPIELYYVHRLFQDCYAWDEIIDFHIQPDGSFAADLGEMK